MKVIKRNGNVENFSICKVSSAVEKAFKSCNKEIPKGLRQILLHTFTTNGDTIGIEEIQNKVEEILMNNKFFDVAKNFILYRERHKNIRNFVRRKEEFINNYKRSSNTANATVDDNSNVSNKNIGILNAEIHKEDNIEISRGMITNKLKELFPDLDHKSYINDLNHHIIYKHDESSFAGAISPYTYSPKETVQAIYGKNHWLVSLDTLYDLVDCEEVLEDSEKEVYCKYPEELYVKDRASWTLVTRLTKKKRHRPLVRVKTSFGEDLVVTDNHPLIISDNIEDTIPAIEASGYNQLRVNPDITFNGTDILDISSIVNYTVKYSNYILQQNESNAPYYSCKRYLKLDRNFGYFVGFFVGDGHYDNTRQCISFTQKDKTVLEHLAEIIYDSLGVSSIVEYKKDKTNCWKLYVNSKALYSLFKEHFQIKDYAQNKNIPINVLEFTEEFAKGIIEGIIDSDGTIQNNGVGVLIRLSSRECINQITTLLRYFNYGVANTCQSTSFSNNTSYSTNYTIWGVSFNNTVGCTKFDNSFKWKEKINREVTKYIKYKEGWVNIDSVKKVEDSSFMDQCDYIYDITTESHTFISSNILVHNCVSISMYPFLLNGIKGIGGLSAAPRNLDSFCGMYINLIFATSAMYAGAVATSEFFVYFDYFARKEWGDDYYKNPDKSISINTLREKTIKSQIHQYFQQVIYSVNQPAAARGMQSAFVNFSYFDKPFFEGMFGNFYFPDGSQPIWESLSWLQKDFMQWFNAERLRTMMTFPVESFALVFKDGEFVDKESAEFVAEEYARGHSFFTYISDTVDSLSSCCFKGSTKVLWKCSYDGVHLTSLKELYNLKWDPYKKNLRIFHNGSWVKGSPIKLTARPLYKVTTFNNKEYYMTDNHINVTLDGEKTTEKLTTNDYLLFNTQPLNAIAENDEHLTFAQGFVIGSFLGDGSFNGKSRNGIIYETVISQNVNKYKETVNQFKSALNSMGLDNTVRVDDPYNNVYNVRISCKELVAFIQKWTNWHERTYSYNKELNLNCLAQSIDFRKGILAGWYSTDGGNSNRCYTTSPKLAEDMEALITSLGMQSIIDVSDRTDEKVIIRDQEYNRNYSLYCIRWYEEANHRQNKDTESSWIKFNNGIYFKIKSIEKIDNDEEVYCIECKNAKEPYFTLPSGLITHNCRLKNKVQTKEFSFTNGNLGIQTGSKSVITLNLNRIVQDYFKTIDTNYFGNSGILYQDITEEDMEGFKKYLEDILKRIYKYHIAYNELLWDMYNANLLPVYKEGFISLDNQYLTIGINGLNQAAEFLGMECNNNDHYRKFCRFIFTTLKESNSKANGVFNGHKLTFNTECVPRHCGHIKPHLIDSELLLGKDNEGQAITIMLCAA